MARSDRILALDIGASNLKLGEFQRRLSGCYTGSMPTRIYVDNDIGDKTHGSCCCR